MWRRNSLFLFIRSFIRPFRDQWKRNKCATFRNRSTLFSVCSFMASCIVFLSHFSSLSIPFHSEFRCFFFRFLVVIIFSLTARFCSFSIHFVYFWSSPLFSAVRLHSLCHMFDNAPNAFRSVHKFLCWKTWLQFKWSPVDRSLWPLARRRVFVWIVSSLLSCCAISERIKHKISTTKTQCFFTPKRIALRFLCFWFLH